MTVVSLVEKVNELEKEIAASSSIDKEVVARHVRRLMSATGLTTVPSMYVMGEDLLFYDDLLFDNIPICHFGEDAKVADTTATGGRSTMQDDQIARDIVTLQRLGPLPEEALRAFVDLGLDDHEIGRYYAVPPAAVSTLRKHYRIATANDEASKADRMIGNILVSFIANIARKRPKLNRDKTSQRRNWAVSCSDGKLDQSNSPVMF